MSKSVLQKLLGIDFTAVDSTQKHALGIEVDCNDGNRRKYIRAGAAITAKQVLKVDYAEGPNDFTPTAAVNEMIAGVSEVAMTDNYFGWVVVKGSVVALMENGAVAGDRQGSSATAGSVTKLVVTGGGVTAAEAERICSAAAGLPVICTTAPSGAEVFGTVRIG